jgi:hypothetical protein
LSIHNNAYLERQSRQEAAIVEFHQDRGERGDDVSQTIAQSTLKGPEHATEDGIANSRPRCKKYHAYEIEAGFLKEEAIELFQQFYTMENQRAPEEKRKRRREKDTAATNA